MTGLFLVVALFVCLLLGVPIAVSLGFASVVTLMLFSDQTLLSLSQKFFHTMQVYPLLAIPFFILAGTLMTSGGVAKRMIAFADALVGHMHGGLAMASVLARFENDRSLLPLEHGVQHKTGTLRDVRSMVGYLDSSGHGLVRFIIWMDGSGHQRRWRIIDALQAAL